jgi:hypothetical protein
MEAVRSDLYCAIVSEGIDLQCSGYELSCDFAADVVPDAVYEQLAAAGQAGLVVIELEVFGNQGCERCQIAVVIGVEEFGAKELDDLEERIGCGARLRAYACRSQAEGEP